VSQPLIQLFKTTVGVVETSGEAETEAANVSLLGKLGSLKTMVAKKPKEKEKAAA
jgi:hypothetical protein